MDCPHCGKPLSAELVAHVEPVNAAYTWHVFPVHPASAPSVTLYPPLEFTTTTGGK